MVGRERWRENRDHMFLSPSKETESQSTCKVLLGGSFLGGRKSRGKPRDDDDDDVCVCVYTRACMHACVRVIKLQRGFGSGVITRGVTDPSVLSSPPPPLPSLNSSHCLVTDSSLLRL